MKVDVREEVLRGCSGREEELHLEHSFILVVFRGGIGDPSGLDFDRVLEGVGQKMMSLILFNGACLGTVELLSSSKSGGSLGSSIKGGGIVQPGGN